eukprot:2628334-Prymnesium_polylepis.1
MLGVGVSVPVCFCVHELRVAESVPKLFSCMYGTVRTRRVGGRPFSCAAERRRGGLPSGDIMAEAEDAEFGAVLRARSLALRATTGLGPPDM